MKIKLLTLPFLCIPFILNAQDCLKEIVFEISDNKTYQVSCGETSGEAWIVSRNSCNFYSPLTTVQAGTNGAGRTVRLQAAFQGSDNLEERDFIWIFYFVDGKTIQTKTLKGEPGKTDYSFSDSFFVEAGSNFRIRIAFVSDEQDEFWKLNSRELSVCILSENKAELIAEKEVTGVIAITKEREIAKLNWKDEQDESGNYFEVERSKNGTDFEFAGFVKTNAGSEGIKNYSFIDARPFKPQSWYRIYKVNISGNREQFGTTTSIPF